MTHREFAAYLAYQIPRETDEERVIAYRLTERYMQTGNLLNAGRFDAWIMKDRRVGLHTRVAAYQELRDIWTGKRVMVRDAQPALFGEEG